MINFLSENVDVDARSEFLVTLTRQIAKRGSVDVLEGGARQNDERKNPGGFKDEQLNLKADADEISERGGTSTLEVIILMEDHIPHPAFRSLSTQ